MTFGLINAEVFPWATIYALSISKVLNYRLLALLILLLVSALIFAISTNFVYLSEHVRALAAYVNPLIIFFALLAADPKEISKLEKLVSVLLVVLIVLGFLQLVGALTPLDSFFKFLVPRGSSGSLSEIGRGVTLLASEPSRAGYELLFIYAAWRALSVTRSYIWYDLFILSFILIVVQSALAAIFALIYLLLLYRSRLLILLLIGLPIVVVLVLSVDSRATSIIRALVGFSSIASLFDFLIDASGFRLVSIISSYWYGVTHIFGGGVGLWQTTSIIAMESSGFTASEIHYFVYNNYGSFGGIRPTSYAANLALDIGFVGLMVFITILFKYIKLLYTFGSTSSKCFAGLFLFSFFVIGTVGNPIPWVLFAVITSRVQINRQITL